MRFMRNAFIASAGEHLEEFDRWLATHDAEVIKAAKSEAWEEGAKWAAVECGAIDNEANEWLAPGDNPYLDTKEATK